MAGSTRGASPKAPARALISGSLGPGSRESARASRKDDAEEDPAEAAANQDDDLEEIDDIDLEAMRE